MNESDIVSLIGSLGFPIVMCLILVFILVRIMKSVQDALNKNTEALTKLIDKVDQLKDGDSK